MTEVHGPAVAGLLALGSTADQARETASWGFCHGGRGVGGIILPDSVSEGCAS